MGTDAGWRPPADDPWYVVGIDDEDVGQRRRVDDQHGSALPVAGEQLGGDASMRNACASGVFGPAAEPTDSARRSSASVSD